MVPPGHHENVTSGHENVTSGHENVTIGHENVTIGEIVTSGGETGTSGRRVRQSRNARLVGPGTIVGHRSEMLRARRGRRRVGTSRNGHRSVRGRTVVRRAAGAPAPTPARDRGPTEKLLVSSVVSRIAVRGSVRTRSANVGRTCRTGPIRGSSTPRYAVICVD
jgi:hypothetical protein